MPRIPGTSNQQSAFLRAFRTHQNGPPPELWPSPAIFRRWMRRPTFARAVDSLLQAVRLQTDFHLAFAACQAARQAAQTCAAAPASTDPAAPAPRPPDPNQLFRLHHLRQRFAAHATANGQPQDNPNKSKDDEEPDLPEEPYIFYPIMENPERREAYKYLMHSNGEHRWDHLFKKYELTHPANSPNTICPEQVPEPQCH